MPEGQRQRVGGVERAPRALAGEQREDHGPDLVLLGLAVPHEGLLHEARLVLEDRYGRAGGGGQQDAARVGELQGRGDVLRREDGLDRDGGGGDAGEQFGRGSEQEIELLGERQTRGRTPHAATLEPEMAALEGDDSETGRDGSGIEAEDDHGAAGASSKSKLAQTCCTSSWSSSASISLTI